MLKYKRFTHHILIIMTWTSIKIFLFQLLCKQKTFVFIILCWIPRGRNIAPRCDQQCSSSLWPAGALRCPAGKDTCSGPIQSVAAPRRGSQTHAGSQWLLTLDWETSGQRRDAAAGAAACFCCTFPECFGPGANFGARLQPWHPSCHQERRRGGQHVRILHDHAPSTQPG